MTIRVFHPSVAPFVQQAALAFHEAGMLERFITTVAHDPDSRTQRALFRAASACGLSLESRWRRRDLGMIPHSVVSTFPAGELLRLATGAFDRDGRFTDKVWEWAELRFDRLVARGLRPGLGGLYGFEYSSLAAFNRARKLGIPTVYELPAPEPRFVQSVLDQELEAVPELRTAYHRYTAEREERRIARRRAEWHAADIRVCASTFSRDSYASAGLDVSGMIVVPYGAPPAVSEAEAASGGTPDNSPPVFLWAGTFGMRKGAHHLIEAWRSGHFGRHARLRIFGRIELPDRLMLPLPEGIEIGGSIPRPELMGHYHRADLLVFPTLCDGFGLVATEAWSTGLPVLTTSRAGVADMLRPGVNGLLMRHGDPGTLAETLTWCLENRPALRAMRQGARATAAAWQWSDYRLALRQHVLQALASPATR